jgi:hypothetical protein
MRIPSLLLAPVVFAIEVVTAATHTANWCNQYFCIAAQLDASQDVTSLQTVTFQVDARRDVGWLGIGTGYGMEGSKIVLLWKGDEGCVASERDGVSSSILLSRDSGADGMFDQHGHVPPAITSNKTLTALISSANSTFLSCKYSLPTSSLPFFMTQNPQAPTAPMGMMWAFSSQAPVVEGGGKAEDAKIRRHEDRGIFDLVFHETTKAKQSSGGAVEESKGADEKMERRARVMRAHVVFMVGLFPITFRFARRLIRGVESRMDDHCACCGPHRPLRTVRTFFLSKPTAHKDRK